MCHRYAFVTSCLRRMPHKSTLSSYCETVRLSTTILYCPLYQAFCIDSFTVTLVLAQLRARLVTDIVHWLPWHASANDKYFRLVRLHYTAMPVSSIDARRSHYYLCMCCFWTSWTQAPFYMLPGTCSTTNIALYCRGRMLPFDYRL